MHSWNCLYRVGVTAMKFVILTVTGSISGIASGSWARLGASPMGSSGRMAAVSATLFVASWALIAVALRISPEVVCDRSQLL